MKGFKEILAEGPPKGGTRDYILTVMNMKKRSYPEMKVQSKMGYEKFTFKNGYIISDGSGLAVHNKKGKEIKYFDSPKVNYDNAVSVIDNL